MAVDMSQPSCWHGLYASQLNWV